MKAIKGWREQLELWLTLTFLTALGWAFGLILTALLIGFLDAPTESMVVLILAGILGGALIGLLYLIVLRNMVRSVEIWILSAITGWTLGVLVTLAIIQLIPGMAGWLVGGAVGGLLFGFSQRTGMRGKSGAGFSWVLLNALTWLIVYGAAILLPADLTVEQISAVSQPLSLSMISWVLVGTLAVLVEILVVSRLPRKKRGEKIQWWP
jgi:hypothetical protein